MFCWLPPYKCGVVQKVWRMAKMLPLNSPVKNTFYKAGWRILFLSCAFLFSQFQCLFFSFKRTFYLTASPKAGSRRECCLEIKPQKEKAGLPWFCFHSLEELTQCTKHTLPLWPLVHDGRVLKKIFYIWSLCKYNTNACYIGLMWVNAWRSHDDGHLPS